MAYMSTTRPGQKRGEHYHLHKVERFFVVKGEAEIQLRRLLHDEVVTFQLSGHEPVLSWTCRPCGCTTSATSVTRSSSPCSGPTNCSTRTNPDQFPELVAEECVA